MVQVQCEGWPGPVFITEFRPMFAYTQELDEDNK